MSVCKYVWFCIAVGSEGYRSLQTAAGEGDGVCQKHGGDTESPTAGEMEGQGLWPAMVWFLEFSSMDSCMGVEGREGGWVSVE